MFSFRHDQQLNAFRMFFSRRVDPHYFRKLWPTIVILLCLFPNANATVDGRVGTSVRSYPLSGVMEGEIGIDGLLWGDPHSIWYGFVRPRLYGSTALTYNSLEAGVQFFPISFLGITAADEAIQNDQKYSAYDCVQYECLGRFDHRHIEATLMLGAGPVFLQAKWRREQWTASHKPALDIIEPTSGLALRAAGDAETVYQGLVGYRLSSSWSIVGGTRYAKAADRYGISRFSFALLRYHDGRLSLGMGGGVFKSTLKPEAGSAVFFLSWGLAPSLELH